MADRAFIWYSIPAGSKPTRCRSSTCGAMIYFVESLTSGKKVPVSVEPDGAFDPTSTEPGRGISHYQDCPDVDEIIAARRK